MGKDDSDEEELFDSEEKKLQKKLANIQKRKEEFLTKGTTKALYGMVEQKVKCICMSTDHLLDQKRTKLRELLLAEEVAYTAEYVAMCQRANIERQEELRSKAFALQTKTERERKDFAEKKLLEQKLGSCDAVRPLMSQKTLLEVKQDQLWQIKEKYALEEARREEDRMYHDLMMKNVLSMKEQEEENAKLLWLKQKDAKQNFLEQMKRKEEKIEEEKRLKELERLQLDLEIKMIKEENEKESGAIKKKKLEIIAEFKENLAKDKMIKERRKREEEEIDRAFWTLLKIEEEKEKRQEASNKERLKREMDIFLRSSQELKRVKEEEERKCDEMLEELNRKKRMQKDAERKMLKMKREALFCDVLKEREEQVKAKREHEKQVEEQRQKEIELLTLQIEQQKKIREEYERKCAEQREAYRCQLLKQMQEVEDAKRREKEQDTLYLNVAKAAEEKELEEVQALIRALPIGLRDHPMKAIAKETPPSYVCMFPCPK